MFGNFASDNVGSCKYCNVECQMALFFNSGGKFPQLNNRSSFPVVHALLHLSWPTKIDSCVREDQVTVIVNGTVLRNSTPYIPRKLSLFCSSLALVKRLVITIVMITFFFIGLQTVRFGLKTIYNSTPSNEYK